MFVIDSPICVSIRVPSNLDICTSLTVIHRWKTYKNCGRHCFKYIMFTDSVLPACLLKDPSKEATVAIATGWGTMGHRKPLAEILQMMLSVQVPGCAGMERLGAPGGPRLRHDHRHHHSTLEWEKQQRLQVQAMVGRLQEMVEQDVRARSAAAAERLGLPPSIQLPDGEYGQDVHLQLRVPYQQAELTRSSFQPPPNKCVSDVPEWAGRARAARAARRVTARAESTLTFHIRAARAARAPDSYRLAIYLFGSAAPRPCSSRRLRVSRKLRLR